MNETRCKEKIATTSALNERVLSGEGVDGSGMKRHRGGAVAILGVARVIGPLKIT